MGVNSINIHCFNVLTICVSVLSELTDSRVDIITPFAKDIPKFPEYFYKILTKSSNSFGLTDIYCISVNKIINNWTYE